MNKKTLIVLGIGLCTITACVSSIISVTVATNQFYTSQLNNQNQGSIETQDLPNNATDATIQNSHNILTSELPTTESATDTSTAVTTTDTVITAQTTLTDNTSYIGEAKAKEIALAHAGLKESDVTFIHCKLDYDDGITEYEVEFYSENKEYDYDIDATTGAILSYDFDMEYGSIPQGGTSTTPNYTVSIDEAKAISIALAHANLSESGVTGLRCNLDYDDGIAEYEVEWYVGRTEYEYTIHAGDGTILEFDVDRD